MSKEDLTGNYYFKQTWFGLVLMVEYRIPDDIPGIWIRKWRRAKAKDLCSENLILE